jgi:hypothetical protein
VAPAIAEAVVVEPAPVLAETAPAPAPVAAAPAVVDPAPAPSVVDPAPDAEWPAELAPVDEQQPTPSA